MANVVEVIHKIDYEINDSSLQRATDVIINQLKEINRLNSALRSYQQELNNAKNLNAFEVISAKIDTVTKQIEASAAKSKGVLAKFTGDLIKDLSVDALKSSVSSYLDTVKGKMGEVSKQGSTLVPIFNSLGETISTVSKSGGGAVSSFAALGSTLLSFSGIAPIVISLLAAIGGEFLASADGLDLFSSKIKDTRTETEKIVQSFSDLKERSAELASEELINVQTLYQTATNVNQSYQTRINAVKQLQDIYPDYFGNLSQEAILAGNAATEYDRLTQAILNKAAIEVYKDELAELAKEKRRLEKDLEWQNKFLADKKKQIKDLGPDAAFKPDITKDNARIAKIQLQIAANEAEQNKIAEDIQVLQASIFSGSRTHTNIRNNDNFPYRNSVYVNRDNPRQTNSILSLSTRGVDQFPVPEQLKPSDTKFDTVNVPDFKTPRMPSKAERFMFGDTADIKDPEQRRRKEIIQSIDAYKQLTQAAVDAYQTITDAQIRALDKEIEVRQKRVDAATKLAERGNTEVLRIEEERLNKAQKKREEIARKQMIVNAALAVSNAIAGVAETATTGPAAIVLIPAVIAAIIAGYAAVSAVTKESAEQAFADGVVGYKGKGGPRDDMNRVWISSGESVITAEGTAKNRALLESINKGAQFSMLAPQLNPMYQLQSPAGGGYASRGEMHTLEKKMDTLIDAVSANGTTVHANVDERGLSLMTVKQIKRDQNRFR